MPQFLAKIGAFSARHRLIVIAAWLVVFAALTGIVATSSSSANASGGSMPSTPASQALEVTHQKFPATAANGTTTPSLQLVLETRGTAKVTDAPVAADIAAILRQAAALPQVSSVSNPFDPARPYVSADGTTVVATLSFHGLTDANQQRVYDNVLHLADTARGEFTAEVGGELFAPKVPTFGAGELVGILVAFVVLVLTFGSLVAAGANLLVAFLGVGVGTLGVLACNAFSPVQPTTITLATMLGLAVGIDYSLFILTRFRAELREGRAIADAIARAIGSAGTSVVFAGLTVIIALAGLSVVGIGFISEMGLAGAFGVLIAVLMALTLLPVLLRTLGRRALPRRERHAPIADRRTAEASGTARWSLLRSWGNVVVRRPVVSLVGAIVVIVVIAVPVLSMRTASSIPGGDDPGSTERHAYNLVVDKFGGVQSPLLVLVQGEGVSGKLSAVQAGLRGLDDVRAVTAGAVDSRNDAALLTVVPNGGPVDAATKTLVTDIRDRADRLAGVHLEVTGETAIGIDDDAMMQSALIEYLIIIVGLSLLLLMVLFRSILVPLIATLGYLGSVGAAFGATVAVFQWGWLRGIMAAPQGDPMLSMLPIILVGVLFGLSMDYQVFLGSRIQEAYRAGRSPRQAVLAGFGKSAPVVVAAAAIMTVVFAGFASSPMATAASIALGLVVGVLVDAFVVRMVIMPAVLSLLGDSAWWLPKWLDRVLPRLDAEGHSLEQRHWPASDEDTLVLAESR